MSAQRRLLITGKLCVLGLMAALLTACTKPDVQDLRDFVATTKAASPGRKLDPLPKVEPYRPVAYAAQGLKNPFAPAEFIKQAGPPAADNGVHPDLNRPREALERYALGSLVMVGTIDKGRLWALVRAPDGIVHRVGTGNYLGTDYGKVTTITEQRIEIKEIISDGTGWIEHDNLLSLAQ